MIATVADLAPGSAVAFTEADTGRSCVLVRLEGEDFVAYSAECTHQDCTVSYKTDDSGDGYLACTCHNSIFEPAEGGRVVSGPADEPLQKVPIEVRDRKIFRALAGLTRRKRLEQAAEARASTRGTNRE